MEKVGRPPSTAPSKDPHRSAEAVGRRDEVVIDLTDGREEPLASFADRQSGVTVEVHHPLASPNRWRAYLDGAEMQYAARGVSQALPRAELDNGRQVSLFFVAVDRSNRVVGGIRCHGPLRAPAEAYALLELAGHPELGVVRELISNSVAAGVVEIKGAWVDRESSPLGVSGALARCHVHAMRWFAARYAMCTCSDVVAGRWASTGGRPFANMETVPYPDARYRTVLLWWDRERLAELADGEQWDLIEQESHAIASGSERPGPSRVVARGIVCPEFLAEVLDERDVADAARLAALCSDPTIEILDRLHDQRVALSRVRPPVADDLADEGPRWAYYPWRRSLVRLLGPRAFRALRLDRNRNKITPVEQDQLGGLRVGVVGLSVGHVIAHVLALEGICGALRLADFDVVELSNLNRVPATVLDLGINKAVVSARRIAELDPYLRVEVMEEGLDAANMDRFVEGLDVVVEECDSLDVKALVRESARRSRIPVLMETSDRGLFDVERFDEQPQRPLFHGLLGDVEAADLEGLSTHDKVPHVLRILEPDQLSSRMAASMAEIDETLTTWPQLGGDVMLGGATIAAAIRALGRGDPLPSGRTRVDLRAAMASLAEPVSPETPRQEAGEVLAVPRDPVLAVAHAAHLAPSGGNVQPWTLHVDEHGLRIHLDRGCTSALDVHHRGSLVAIGAAAFNARAAAAANGLLGPVAVFPHGTGSDAVVALEFGNGNDPELAANYVQVLDRTTNRRPGVRAPIPDEVVQRLDEEVRQGGSRLHLLTSEDSIAEYADLLGESDRLRFLTPLLHAEMMAELRWPGESVETGIDVRTLELDESDVAKLAVARRADVMADLAAWNGGRALGEVTRTRVRTSSALAAVTVSGSEASAYVAGGASVQRLWLAANAAGLGVQPVSPVSVFAVSDDDFAGLVPPPYVARLQTLTERLRRILDLESGEHFALVVRLSHAGPSTVRSERQPLRAVLRP